MYNGFTDDLHSPLTWCNMAIRFDEGGIRFQYPENWRLEREDTEEGWTLSLQSPDTAFALISVNENSPSSEDMLAAALDALKSEYKDVEVQDCVDTIAGQPAVGQDIRFISLDLTNTCWTRSFY